MYRSPDYDVSMGEVERYHRQQILPGIGSAGQERIAAGHVVIVGLGALGCAVADHLARAGVGTLTLIDRDIVDRTNLQRQSLYTERDAGEGLPKAVAARHRLTEVNSEITIRAHIADLTAANVDALLFGSREVARPDVVLDGTDNFDTRYLLNDIAVRDGIPLVYGGVVGTRGMQMTIRPGVTPCLRCLFERPPMPGTQPTCDTAGVLGPVVAIVAGCQASDAIRLLLGDGDAISETLLEFDLWAGRRRRLDLAEARRADCPCCGRHEYEFLARNPDNQWAILCGQRAVQIMPASDTSDGGDREPGGDIRGLLDLDALATCLAAAGEVEARPFMLRFVPHAERAEAGGCLTITVFRDGRAIVAGTTEPDRARSVLAKYIGV